MSIIYYLEKCPSCGCHDFEEDMGEREGEEITILCTCTECQYQWKAYFKFEAWEAAQPEREEDE